MSENNDFGAFVAGFIVGGLVLVYGGYRLEKWRRRLLAKA